MAVKNYELKFSVDSKEVDIMSDRTLRLTEQYKILKRELETPGKTREQFEALRNKFNEVGDAIKSTQARSRELFGTFQLIPGPIGEISSKIDGTISLFKTFGDFKFSDLKGQFAALITDLKGIGKSMADATGITRIFTTVSAGLEKTFVAFGMSADKAARAARGWGAALTGIGIGLVIAGIYALVEAFNELSEEQKTQNELATKSAEIASKQISTLDQLSNTIKQSTLTDRQKEEAVKQYNATLGETLGKVENYIQLEDKLKDPARLAQYKAYLLEKARAEAISLTIVEVQRKKIEKELSDPASLASAYDVWSEGGLLGFFIEGKEGIGKNIQQRAISNFDKTLLALQTKLTETNTQIAAQQKQLGLGAPTTTPTPTKKTGSTGPTPEQQAAQALALQKKALDDQIELEINSKNTRESILQDLFTKRQALDEKDYQRTIADAKKLVAAGKLTKDEYQQILDGIEAQRKLVSDKNQERIKNSLKEDAKEKEILLKNQKDFEDKIAEIKIQAIEDDTEREIAARKLKYERERAAIMQDTEFLKKSFFERIVILANLQKAYQNDVNKITQKGQETAFDKEMKGYDDRLRLLELQGQGLLQGTRAYFKNRNDVLDTSEKKELAAAKKNAEEKKLTKEQAEAEELAIQQKYSKLRQDNKQQEVAAIGKLISAGLDVAASITQALASQYDEEAKTSRSAFEQRKKLQIATAVMSSASGIVQILTQPSTLKSPLDWIFKGINAAALVVKTGIEIGKIKATKFEGETTTAPKEQVKVVATRAQGGIVSGPGTSTSDSIPAMISNGEYVVNARATRMFLPMIDQINEMGKTPGFALGGLLSNRMMKKMELVSRKDEAERQGGMREQPIIKTYVVSTEMSNRQQFDRTQKMRSTL